MENKENEPGSSRLDIAIITALSVTILIFWVLSALFLINDVPKCAGIFRAMRVELPLPTKVILKLSAVQPLALGGMLVLAVISILASWQVKRRAVAVAVIGALVAGGAYAVERASMELPIRKIHEALRKK